jgi:hypothetical protein
MVTTFFKGLRSTKPEKVTDLSEILEGIQNGKWKDASLKCREDLSKKDRLPCFTPTGRFNHRSIKGLEEYNGIICLDIDHVTNPEELKERVTNLGWVMAAFVTPSGQGLKVIVKTHATTETFKKTEELVAAAFLEATGCARDNRCKDIARIQFVSYDPTMYYNPHAITF